MVDEVTAHMKVILEVGAISSSQSHGVTVLLVHKKEVCTFALTFIS